MRQDRHFAQHGAQRGQGVVDRIEDRRDGRNRSALSRALDAERIQRARRLQVDNLDTRNIGRERQKVLAEIGG